MKHEVITVAQPKQFRPYSIILRVETAADHAALLAISSRDCVIPHFLADQGWLTRGEKQSELSHVLCVMSNAAREGANK